MTAAKLRKALRAWPGVTEDIKWGHDRVWSVGGKMFCVLPDDASTGPCFKVPDEDFLALTERPGIKPAPYLARARWVLLDDLKTMPEAELMTAIRGSYALIKAKLPRKTQREIDGT